MGAMEATAICPGEIYPTMTASATSPLMAEQVWMWSIYVEHEANSAARRAAQARAARSHP